MKSSSTKLSYIAVLLAAGITSTLYWHHYSSPELEHPPPIVIEDNRDKLLEIIFGESFDSTAPIYSINVDITAYSARVEECNSEPWVTASGALSRVGQLAISRDLLHEIGLKYGQVVIIENIGVFRIRDTMNPRFSRRVDILMGNYEAARRFGKKPGKLYWIGATR